MAAEFIVKFETPEWYSSNTAQITAKLFTLGTFSKCVSTTEFWLVGTEPKQPGAWQFDVRVFMKPDMIFLEISSHSPSIERDLSALFSWVRKQTRICIEDEDGVPSGW
ncbi:MAG: 3-hydroxydecyl-ACP dehydratase [Pseudomonas sp.]|uniref:3-hydroxydecyl-ACP dehydratase n=1 Tax=Pseudomonas sp. TaxID=306 RepID=UPI003D6FFF47